VIPCHHPIVIPCHHPIYAISPSTRLYSYVYN
jgi:hypothetical protein